MTASISSVPTTIRPYEDTTATIEPGMPWPGVYRGSKYSLTGDHRRPNLSVVHQGLTIDGEVPAGLTDNLQAIGKSNGTGLGTFRVTADKHVLTKVHSDDYPHVADALIDEGWIPVYVGKLSGIMEFHGFDNDPSEPPMLWSGLTFKHGERWTVTVNGLLQWRYTKGQRFHFPSIEHHSDLVSAYQSVRKSGGRLRVNEYGHVWMEAPIESIQRFDKLYDGVQRWLKQQEREGNNELVSMLYRKLKRTGGGDPSNGNVPLYVGHVSDFDLGTVPIPIVTDPEYYLLDSEIADGNT